EGHGHRRADHGELRERVEHALQVHPDREVDQVDRGIGGQRLDDAGQLAEQRLGLEGEPGGLRLRRGDALHGRQGLLQAQHVAEAQQAAGRLGGSRRGRSGRRRRGGGRGGRGLLVLLVLVGGGAGGGGGARGGGGGRRSGRRGRLVAAAEQAADDPADAVGQALDQPFGGPARHTTGDAVDQ